MILAIDKIRTDGGTQSRAQIDGDIVEEYAQVFLTSPRFPLPPVVVFYDGNEYWLADGFHRLAAAKLAAKTELRVDIVQGTQREAILYSVGANAKHGLRRTNADKRRAVETLLRDEEWSKKSDRWIAEKCGTGHPFVASVRSQLESDSSSPERTGQDGKTRKLPTKREPAPVDPYPDAPWIRHGSDPEHYMTAAQRGEYTSLRDSLRHCARENMLSGTSIDDALRRASDAQRELEEEELQEVGEHLESLTPQALAPETGTVGEHPQRDPRPAVARQKSAPPAPMPAESPEPPPELRPVIRDSLLALGARQGDLAIVATMGPDAQRFTIAVARETHDVTRAIDEAKTAARVLQACDGLSVAARHEIAAELTRGLG